ncbi:MAG: hypothetical protein ACRDHN_07170 [Thermomicrobiales bacterium]
MMAKSLDVYALVKLLLEKGPRPYGAVASELGMSASEYHAAVQRLGIAGLIDPESRAVRKRPARDFLFHGLRYVFPATRGSLSRGLPTSYAASPLKELISSAGGAMPVWASADGQKLGYAIEPLHPSAPKAAARDSQFYEYLALIDAIREGRPRESRLAMVEIDKRLQHA